MASNPLGINSGTQNFLNFDLVGTVNTQVVNVGSGTVTLSNPTGTTVQFNNGTINVLPNLPGGSIVMTAGTIVGGTLQNLNGGTLNAATAVLNSGTINVATVTLNSGTINVGTVVNNGGTIQNLNGGTLNAATVVLNTGTISVLPNLPQGSIQVTNGTVIVTGGSVVQTSGTINTGTVRLDPTPTRVVSSYGTTTTGTIGTLVAAPSAGSGVFVTALAMNVQSGTAETIVSFGLVTNGQGVLARGNFAAGGGMATSYPTPNSANNTGTALTFNILSGSGTVSYTVAYFVAIP